MKAISKEIRLDSAELYANEDSIFHVFYADEFTKLKETGRYHIQSLLKIGFLHCDHYSVDTQSIDMWHILNPKLDDSVPREKVEEFINDLVFISVDLMLKYIPNMGLSLKEKGTTTVTEVAR